MKVDKADILKAAMLIKDRVEEAVILRLQRIGEQFIINARNNGNYTDQTGNLRSSIGYVILKNGLQLSGSDWIQVRPGAEAGVKAGQKLIEELARKYPTGIILICVAGMHYAAAVESKGYDVITSSAFVAENEFLRGIQAIKEKLLS